MAFRQSSGMIFFALMFERMNRFALSLVLLTVFSISALAESIENSLLLAEQFFVSDDSRRLGEKGGKEKSKVDKQKSERVKQKSESVETFDDCEIDDCVETNFWSDGTMDSFNNAYYDLEQTGSLFSRKYITGKGLCLETCQGFSSISYMDLETFNVYISKRKNITKKDLCEYAYRNYREGCKWVAGAANGKQCQDY
jgi:hypothetical protein